MVKEDPGGWRQVEQKDSVIPQTTKGNGQLSWVARG
jgi:hypothetical protein